MSPDFKRMAAAEIEEFKKEYIALNPVRTIEDVSYEDLLRVAMNTIGKSGRLGEQAVASSRSRCGPRAGSRRRFSLVSSAPRR